MQIYKLLFLLLLLCLCACREVIVHDLSETEANKMMTRLLASELDASKEKQADGKWALSLPKEQASAAIRFLSDHRMLKEESVTLSQKAGLMVSKEEQRFRYERALSHEIETTLANMSGVLQARVHLNLPVIDPIFGQNIDNSKSSASVMLVLENKQVNIAEISALVAGASGIPLSSISVITSRAGEVKVARNAESVDVIENAVQINAGKISQVPFEDNIIPKIKHSAYLSDLRSNLAKIPWPLIGSVIALVAMIIGVFRIINKHEKIAM